MSSPLSPTTSETVEAPTTNSSKSGGCGCGGSLFRFISHRYFCCASEDNKQVRDVTSDGSLLQPLTQSHHHVLIPTSLLPIDSVRRLRGIRRSPKSQTVFYQHRLHHKNSTKRFNLSCLSPSGLLAYCHSKTNAQYSSRSYQIDRCE
jgi:hypothetical protein